MAVNFDISAEERASTLQFLRRQLFIAVPPVSRRDADLTGKTAIVTGASVGLGLETARQLLDLGCKVILAVRDESRGERARQEIVNGRDLPPSMIEVWLLDLASYDSITSFAERARGLEHLDIVILNAGLYKFIESFSSTGYEEGIQVNYLSNMLLAILLLPIVRDKRIGSLPGRIALVSSDQAAWAKFHEKDSSPLLPAFKQKMASWDDGDRYGTTKLLGQLFVTQLAKRVSSREVIISCPNPGLCRGSDLARQAGPLRLFVHTIQCRLIAHTCSVGAHTIVAAATTLGESAHGQYIEDGKAQP